MQINWLSYFNMKFLKVRSLSDPYFEEAWDLYTSAFPEDEQRSKTQQEYLLTHPLYHFNLILEKEKFLGFILWWEFEGLCFVDHFATSPQFRNQGLGTRILNTFKAQKDKGIVLLEVEHPTTEINKRRIDFYRRMDFQLNPHHYQMPSYTEGGDPVDLLLMSYPRIITQQELDYFIGECHPIIFE